MRRSNAPSMLKAAKSKNGVLSSDFETITDYATQMENWGTKANINKVQETMQNKRVFNVLWREVSMKKNKTWKGDGTLEFNSENKRGSLKDDTGKYMGNITIFREDVLQEGYQMIINGKEIELQDEIQDLNEHVLLRKRQIANHFMDESKQEEPKEKKPKGAFVFQSNLILNAPTMPKTNLNKNPNRYTFNKNDKQNEQKVQILSCTSPNETKIPFLNKLDNDSRNKTSETLDPEVSSEVCEINEKQSDIVISPNLLKHLRPHQESGVSFVYNCLMGYQNPKFFGCILADEMGLGKTLQVLTVAHCLLRKDGDNGKNIVRRVLIVVPSSLTSNWNNELNKWLNVERVYAHVVNAKHKLDSYLQQKHIPFVIASYETVLSKSAEFSNYEFDLLICDEGHRLKNQTNKIYKILSDLKILRRVILTGTPVQNNLQEFFCLADFVNPNIFGTYKHFRQHFEIPLQQSQSPEATEEIKDLATKRSLELNRISKNFLLRRLQKENKKYLPKKREYICFVRPSELQTLLLEKALDVYKTRQETIAQELSPLQIITVLKKICNHPSLISTCKSNNILTRYLEKYLPDWSEMGPFHSGKLELLQHFLTAAALDKQEKTVIVSNHTKTLNMIEGLCDYLNIKCLRLDGSTTITERNQNVKEFNSNSNTTELVFLLSAKAGGVGLNLIGASRLILFDNDWNPATDAQAMGRIWRDGQSNDVHVYRLITAGCIEEKIFQRQISKKTLENCVFESEDKTNQTIKFSNGELLNLFTLQTDMTTCQTHELLKCDCLENGQNLDKTDYSREDKQINELFKWEHYKAPFDNIFLEEACLQNAIENLFYIFSNQTV
ncbi:DNA repair and recombination protein RAD54B-like [Teleopsis dalmanni]|uniref:DNA repair and recombination protein RAD54B-like n=1 Tax=Teleopsis dalmanni TaxID=139649 RepID=UPI0018CEF2C9|nr:DNA repair and recombination protein RAD54B-like [Teleopsis dalmanni]